MMRFQQGVNRVIVSGVLQADELNFDSQPFNVPVSPICANQLGGIGYCGSSIRFKKEIKNYNFGLALIEKIQPVSYIVKDSGIPDMGLVAEDVADVEPLLATYEKDGTVLGVKYDRLGVILINAVKEQQSQIKSQEKEILNLQKQAKAQEQVIQKQLADLKALKALVCLTNQEALVCQKGDK